MSTKPKFIKENGVTLANVADLYRYKDNPRDVESADLERLKEQLRLGEHSTLLVTSEGEVLGGNTRLKAYVEIGKKQAKVVVVEIVETSKGVSIVVDGKQSERTFDTVDQAKIELALSHNDSIGTNNAVKLAELLELHHIDTDIYSVATEILPVGDLINRLREEEAEADKEDLDSEYDKDLAGKNIYEPNGNDVAPSELLTEDRKELLDLIEAVENPVIKEMLLFRYSYFVNFKMGKVADYYCNNATPEEQRAFEALGLVILDHDKAIENGFLEYVEAVESIEDEKNDPEEL